MTLDADRRRALRVESSLSRAHRLALEYGTVEQLRQLVIFQAQQIHRLTGGRESGIPEPVKAPAPPAPPAQGAPDAVAVVERVLGYDDIFRKPPRVAAPRFIAYLADLDHRLERK